MTEPSTAPWTAEQVAALAGWQQDPNVHAFTCPNRGDGRHRTTRDLGVLRATEAGFVCDDCDHTQTWCHAFMLDHPPASGEAAQPGAGDLHARLDRLDRLRRRIPCPTCNGTGHTTPGGEPPDTDGPCPDCDDGSPSLEQALLMLIAAGDPGDDGDDPDEHSYVTGYHDTTTAG